MSDEQEWKACPPGTLSELKSQQQRNESSSVMGRRAALGVLLTAGATAGIVASQSGPEVRQLSCSVAMKMAPDYLAGTLNSDDLASLEKHLSYCPSCKPKMEQLKKAYNV